MTIRTTYQSDKFAPSNAGTRYVRAALAGVEYIWCVVGVDDPRFDIQQGTCDPEDVQQEVREAADAVAGRAFSYVKWPR